MVRLLYFWIEKQNKNLKNTCLSVDRVNGANKKVKNMLLGSVNEVVPNEQGMHLLLQTSVKLFSQTRAE